MGFTEYEPGRAFPGVVGARPTIGACLAGALAGAEGAPNVLFVILDDTGFGHLGCYGIPSPRRP